MGPLAPGGVAPPRQFRPEELLNIRDALSSFVGKGYSGTGDDNARSIFSYLRGQLGPEAAQRILVQMSMHNQRPDMVALSPEDRIQRFYDMGAKDPFIADLIMRTRNVGQGPIPGFRETPDNLSSELSSKKWFLNDRPVQAPGALQTLRNASASHR